MRTLNTVRLCRWELEEWSGVLVCRRGSEALPGGWRMLLGDHRFPRALLPLLSASCDVTALGWLSEASNLVYAKSSPISRPPALILSERWHLKLFFFFVCFLNSNFFMLLISELPVKLRRSEGTGGQGSNATILFGLIYRSDSFNER